MIETILFLLSKIDWFALSFYILSFLLIASSMIVVLSNNIVHSALALVFAFLMIAGLFLTLLSEFLAIVQVLIYAGAISVLLVFSIMIVTNKNENIERSNVFSNNAFIGGLLAAVFFLIVSFIVTHTSWNITYQVKDYSDIEMIAKGFLTTHVIAFEIAALLLLVALVAAIFIIKEANDD